MFGSIVLTCHKTDYIIHHGPGDVDILVIGEALRLEFLIGKLFNEFINGDAILQTHRDSNCPTIGETIKRRSALIHMEEYFARPAVFEIVDRKEKLNAAFFGADNRLMRYSVAQIGQSLTIVHWVIRSAGQGCPALPSSFWARLIAAVTPWTGNQNAGGNALTNVSNLGPFVLRNMNAIVQADFRIASLTFDNAVHTLDLTGIVPSSGANWVYIQSDIRYTNADARIIFYPPACLFTNTDYGYAINRAQVGAQSVQRNFFVPTTNGTIQYKGSASPNLCDIYVLGWGK